MSLQIDLNSYPSQFMLYYCNYINSDSKVYQTTLSDVCTLSFDIDNNTVFSDWLIGGYSMPSNATLLTYVLNDVLTFYNNFYIIPYIIAANQYYQISTVDLASVRADASMIGYRIFDITTRTVKSWSGSVWI